MNKGLWVWPADSKEQQRTLRRVSRSEHLVDAMQAVAKSKEGLSNAEIDDVLTNNSDWMTRWVVEQLVSLGFIEYKVDFFGGPGRYKLTELGADALSAITGKPVQTLQPAPTPLPAAKPTTLPPAAPSK